MQYFLGLDIGSSSVGYAVTNNKYELMRAKGQDLWGVSLFEEAHVAESRRIKRGARRRWERKKLMLLWLQEIFAKEIAKVDENFFIRLKDSALYYDDKRSCLNNSKDSLFQKDINGNTFTDKDFYNLYPTIFHLRKELLSTPAKDIRFLYLALHNIIKSRGHFLNGGGENDRVKLSDSFLQLANILQELEIDCKLNQIVVNEEMEKELNNNFNLETKSAFTFKQKFEKWCNILGVNDDKIAKIIINACIYGKLNKTDIKNLFNLEDVVEINLADDEKMLSGIEQNTLTDLQIELIYSIKNIYSSVVLENLLKGKNYVSEAMVQIYEEHQQQLKDFKSFIKKYYKNEYFNMFRNKNFNKKGQSNYCLYANKLSVNGKKRVLGLNKSGKKADFDRTADGFYAYIRSVLNSKPQIEEYDVVEFETKKQEILSLIDNKNFLIKQRTGNNVTIPNSLYIKELKKILEINQEKFKFLQESLDGITNIEKIISIAKFRVPYYVGPIGNKGKNSWAKRISNEPLRAWNLDKIIDMEDAEEQFIRRMTNSCTYLSGKDALCKNSVIYNKYKCLNELNNLTINGARLNVELKQKLFNELYLTASPKEKITKNKIIKFLHNNQIYDSGEEIVIGGIAEDLQGSMQSYLQIKSIIGEEYAKNEALIEDIVKYHTILQEKENVKKRLSKKYPFLTEQMLKQLKGLNFIGWSTLSKEFLQDLKIVDKTSGEITNILNLLWETGYNLQEILFDDKYAIKDDKYDIEEECNIKDGLDKLKSNLGEIKYEDVQELYCSPSVKRAIWQAIKIINELKELLGDYPEKVFVEVTRGSDNKNNSNKNTRFKKINDLYLKIKKDKQLSQDFSDIDKLIMELNEYKDDNTAFRSDKLFLYFLQLGKCAYCGKSLSISDIYNEKICDIDHIIPQCMKKDDSLDNKVLVDRICNQDVKKDIYPIYSLGFEKKCGHIWNKWLKANLISQEKYDRLTRKEELTAEDRAGFINRQLVETNQSAKAVIDLLVRLLGDNKKIIFSKANLVSEFRHRFSNHYICYSSEGPTECEGFKSLEKCRVLNDLHHAKDAYLNIVVGDVVRQRFTDNPIIFFRNRENSEDNNTTNPIKIFNGKVTNFFNKNIVWNNEVDLPRVAKICAKNSCMVNAISFYKTNGQFYNETVYKSLKNQPKSKAQFALKGDANPLGNIDRYGGYNSLENGYFMLIEDVDKKGNKYRVIEAIPNIILYKNRNNNNYDMIIEYLKSIGFKEPKIILNRINKRSTLKVGDGYFVLTGKTGNHLSLENFNQHYTSFENAHYIKIISKFKELQKSNKIIDEKDNRIVVSTASKDGNTELILTRRENELLYDSIVNKLNNKIYELFGAVKIKLIESEGRFKNLSVANQAIVLYNLVEKLGTTVAPVDLSLLQPKNNKDSVVEQNNELNDNQMEEEDELSGGYKNTGKLLINKNITNKNIKLIIKSALGFKVKEINLSNYGI